MSASSFDLTSVTHKRNPGVTFAKMRDAGEVFKVKLDVLGEVWVTTTYQATVSALRDKENFVVSPANAGLKNMAGLKWWMPSSFKRLANNMLGKDDPDHRRLRQLVESAFMQQSIDDMRPRIEQLVDKHLGRMQMMSQLTGGEVDFLEDFARPFPLDVICELLGLPEEDRLKFHAWGTAFSNIAKLNNPFSMFGGISAIFKINKYLKQQIQECRRNPRPGMLSALVQAEADGHKLSEEELLASAFLLLIAGHETTVHLLTVGLYSLLKHPEQKTALMGDWSKSFTAVDEMLRYNSTIEMTKPRYVRNDIEFCGQSLKRGDVIVPLLGAANHDPAKFENAEEFNINRSPNPHIAFGTGMHVCLGLKLAHAEAEIAFQKLFERFPHLELAIEDSDIEWNPRIGNRAIKKLPLMLTPVSAPSHKELSHA